MKIFIYGKPSKDKDALANDIINSLERDNTLSPFLLDSTNIINLSSVCQELESMGAIPVCNLPKRTKLQSGLSPVDLEIFVGAANTTKKTHKYNYILENPILKYRILSSIFKDVQQVFNNTKFETKLDLPDIEEVMPKL